MKYLNYNSTNPDQYYHFNYSDRAYDVNMELKENLDSTKSFIKRLLNTSDKAKVIFVSGASEACATCMHWIQTVNKYGIIYGSEFDHDSVRMNAENYGFKYDKIDVSEESFENPERCAGLWITYVNSKTGEIYPINNLELVEKQYKPIIVADITQSIGKLDFDMRKYGIDAAYFSLHKIGGPINYGVLVIDSDYEFKPLIAGYQQNENRGGTMDMEPYQNFAKMYSKFKKSFKHGECKAMWNKIVKKCGKNGLDVYKPIYNHLYNTILIRTYHCNLQLIYDLSRENIYVGSTSACINESKYMDPNIRLSFINSGSIDDKTIDHIIQKINESDETAAEEIDYDKKEVNERNEYDQYI